MAENEVTNLCMAAREIFLQQPSLLELETPLKICGRYLIFVSVIAQLNLIVLFR